MKNITAFTITLLLITLNASAQLSKGKQSNEPAGETRPGAATQPGTMEQATPEKSKPAPRFNPTEKVAADDAVPFPVDI
jgi:hypothetical protein